MPQFLGSIDAGYTRIRDPAESSVIQQLLIISVVQMLAMMSETVAIMIEVAPSLSDNMAPFADDFALWSRYRDDAAHIPDRLLREPGIRRNDARSTDETWGDGTTVLSYDPVSDSVLTGEVTSKGLNLGNAIRCAHELYESCSIAISQLTISGKIPHQFVIHHCLTN